MDFVVILQLIGGLVLLTIGGELLVRGASNIARFFRISPLVIGLTVVAFGTSAPELAVSVQAALAGSSDIAIGNVVGSNNLNILFILGVSALIVPLVVSTRLIRVELPLMIFAGILLFFLSLDGKLSFFDGLLLFVILTTYLYLAIRHERENIEPDQSEQSSSPIVLDMLFLIGGLLLLVIGANLLVDGAVSLARSFGVSELIIGLTIVAIGTSLPEVAASIIAAIKGEKDMAIGNIVGSNIFNILAILGITSMVASDGVLISAQALSFDLPLMITVSLLCLPIFMSGFLIDRLEGAFFLISYLLYTIYLVLLATKSKELELYLFGLIFLIPFAVFVIVYGFIRKRTKFG